MSFLDFKKVSELPELTSSQLSSADNFLTETAIGTRRITFANLLSRIQSSISTAITAATSTVRGGVKTNTTSPNPIVYLKSETDSLITGVQSGLDSKLSNGSFLSINNNDRLRFTSTNASNPALDIFRDGGITFYHGNNSSTPVTLTPYNRSGSSEYGLSAPMFRCTGGRFDFDPFEGKTEFRVTGNNTSFGIYNSTMAQPLFTVNGDRSVNLYNSTSISGSITATQFRLSALNTAPASSTSSGTAGTTIFASDGLYFCVGTNQWRRILWSTF
jgi:hypothetical protein